MVLTAAVLGNCLVLASDRPPAESRGPRNEQTLRAILRAAGESNRDIRGRVAWGLGQMGREDAVATLRGLAVDPAPGVRAAALRALYQLVPPGTCVKVTLAVPAAHVSLRHAALYTANQLLFEQREALIKAALASGDVSDRILAVRALALDAPSESRPILLRVLKDDGHTLVRAETIRTLGRGRDGEAVKLVLAGLSEDVAPDSFVVRAAACEALAQMKTNQRRGLLYKTIADEHFFVRRSAIQALVDLDDLAGVVAIQRRMNDADYTVRRAACVALGKLIDRSSPPLLAARLADKVPEVRVAADDALAGFPPDLAYRALLEYVDYRRLKETRRRVWRLLGEYAHPGTRETAFTHLNDSEVFVRVEALRILRKLGDRRIIPLVVAVLKTGRKEMSGRNPPPEGIIEESFKAACLFDLRDGIPCAMFVLQRALAPPESEGYMPSEGVLVAAFKYLAAMKHRAGLRLMERVFEMCTLHGGGKSAGEFAKALEQLTGRPYPLPPPKPKRKPFGVYFIDVQTESEKIGH